MNARGKSKEALAHIGENGEPHFLVEHLQDVSTLAAAFAESLGSSKWAAFAGLWHDLGKYRQGFQTYIAQSQDPDAHIEGKVGGREKTHSAAGALWAMRKLGEAHGPNGALSARVLAYLIASHHAGLYDWDGGLKERLDEADCQTELAEALAAHPPYISI